MKEKWCDKKLIIELTKIKNKIGHFPLYRELVTLHRYDLIWAIRKCGGYNKFRKLLGVEYLIKPIGYWSDERIIIELTKIQSEIGHFPTGKELFDISRKDLVGAIRRFGGFRKFYIILGYEPLHKPNGYWDSESITKDLTKIKENIGHFPTYKELKHIGRSDLIHAIQNYGGVFKFRGYDVLQKPNGYWTEENIIFELKEIINEMGHFPTYSELINSGRQDLVHAIHNSEGFNKFRELLGEPPSLYEKYRSKLTSYLDKRGKNTEKFVKTISQDYCNRNGYPEPKYNIKLSKGHILEFVCNTGKTIGIDVTNTTTKYTVYRKYIEKQYHLHLDELWIVVFSNVFIYDDYFKWNEESPENVKVFSIYGFLEELNYSLDESLKNKIDKYCSCTFHTKEQLKQILKGE